MGSFRRKVHLTQDEKECCIYYVDMILFGREGMKKFISEDTLERQKAKVTYMLKYALEEYFDISTPQAVSTVSNEILKKTKLYKKITSILMADVPELGSVEPLYLARLMYPDLYAQSDEQFFRDLTQSYYCNSRDGGKSLANQYFSKQCYPNLAEKRAAWCLEVVLNEQFNSIEEMYQIFSGKTVNQLLRNARLFNAMEGCGYEYAIDYLNDTIKEDQNHTEDFEALYHLLRWKLVMLYKMQEEKRKKQEERRKRREERSINARRLSAILSHD